MSLLNDFKKFALRGNVLEMAVGIIIGKAFGQIVTSLVNDLLMPVIGLATGKIDVSGLQFKILTGEGNEPLIIKYGLFLQNIIDFVIICVSVFFMIRVINSILRKEEKAKPVPKEEILLTEIRDLLKEQNSQKLQENK